MSSSNLERNFRLKDLRTYASAITTANLSASLYGAAHIDTIKGALIFSLARLGDKGDGWVARMMNQESDAGAFYDTFVDKVGIGSAAINGWRKEVIPRPAIAVIGARSVASVGLTAVMAHNHPGESFRPTMAGKIAMGAESAAFIGYAMASALETERPDLVKTRQIAQGIGHIALAGATIAGSISIAQYTKRAFEK
ncbi:MAG TPA: CDP-alcohol phosphatidyltransferase family protein [Candidatus Saccharimonadales bacterium]